MKINNQTQLILNELNKVKVFHFRLEIIMDEMILSVRVWHIANALISKQLKNVSIYCGM